MQICPGSEGGLAEIVWRVDAARVTLGERARRFEHNQGVKVSHEGDLLANRNPCNCTAHKEKSRNDGRYREKLKAESGNGEMMKR